MRQRSQQIRVSPKSFKYAQEAGAGEAADGLEAIFNDHRIGERKLEEVGKQLSNSQQLNDDYADQSVAADNRIRELEQANATLADHNRTVSAELESERQTCTRFAEELKTACAQRGSADMDRSTANMARQNADSRRKLWRVLFWGQLVVWVAGLAILDAIY